MTLSGLRDAFQDDWIFAAAWQRDDMIGEVDGGLGHVVGVGFAGVNPMTAAHEPLFSSVIIAEVPMAGLSLSFVAEPRNRRTSRRMPSRQAPRLPAPAPQRT
jgi:hypothetical protein